MSLPYLARVTWEGYLLLVRQISTRQIHRASPLFLIIQLSLHPTIDPNKVWLNSQWKSIRYRVAQFHQQVPRVRSQVHEAQLQISLILKTIAASHRMRVCRRKERLSRIFAVLELVMLVSFSTFFLITYPANTGVFVGTPANLSV